MRDNPAWPAHVGIFSLFFVYAIVTHGAVLFLLVRMSICRNGCRTGCRKAAFTSTTGSSETVVTAQAYECGSGVSPAFA